MRPGQNHHAFDVSSQALAYSGCPQASTATVSSTNNRQPLVVWPRPAINLSRAPVTCTHNLQVSNNKRVVPMYHLTATASDAVRDQINNCQVYISVYHVVECPLSGPPSTDALASTLCHVSPCAGPNRPNNTQHPSPSAAHKKHSRLSSQASQLLLLLPPYACRSLSATACGSHHAHRHPPHQLPFMQLGPLLLVQNPPHRPPLLKRFQSQPLQLHAPQLLPELLLQQQQQLMPSEQQGTGPGPPQ